MSTSRAMLKMEGFDEELHVDLPDRQASFHVHVAGRERADETGIIVALHGGGFTGMSWAPAAGLMKRDCCVIAPDLRCHGLTTSTRDYPTHDAEDMSLDTLSEDVTSLLVEIVSRGLLLRRRWVKAQGRTIHETSTAAYDGHDIRDERTGTDPRNDPVEAETSSQQANTESEPNEEERSGAASTDDIASVPCTKLLLVGHSLGGSISVKVAGAAESFKQRCRGAAEIAGVVAVDVVEGTALAALEDMPEILGKIPRQFSSTEQAVLWHVKTGAVRNSASAAVVVPSRLKDDASGGKVVWRTDLRATERHWQGWFKGMSSAFLELDVPKLLIVAGMDRLDTELTAAHMQGRFQLKLVYGCGHSVQEDQPRETSSSIINFAIRHSIVQRIRSCETSGGIRPDEEELRRKLARARAQAVRIS